MSDLWEDEGGGGAAPSDGEGEDDWDEGDEGLEPELEDGLDDPDELEDKSWDEGEE
jgi:hypothetical protein